jgi:hypothetical protein
VLMLVIINIIFGFASGGSIDNAAHLGGLAAGLLLGALVPPTRVPTMSAMWQRPADSRVVVSPGSGRASAPRPGAGIATAPVYIFWLALAVVAVIVVAGIAVGTGQRLG